MLQCRAPGPRPPTRFSPKRPAGLSHISLLLSSPHPSALLRNPGTDGWLTRFSSLSSPVSPCYFPEQLRRQGSHACWVTGEQAGEDWSGRETGRQASMPPSRGKRARPRVRRPRRVEVVRLSEMSKGLRQEEHQRGPPPRGRGTCSDEGSRGSSHLRKPRTRIRYLLLLTKCSKTPWLKQEYKLFLSHHGSVVRSPPAWVFLLKDPHKVAVTVSQPSSRLKA